MRRTRQFGAVKMLRRVAACTIAAILAVWPVRSGVDAGTLDDFTAALTVVAPPHEEAAAAAPSGNIEAQNQTAIDDEAAMPKLALDPAPPATPAATDIEAQDQSASRDAAAARTASLDPAELATALQLAPTAPAAEPFGLAESPVTFGEVVTKWNGVEDHIRADNKILAQCRDAAKACPKAAQDFLAIVAQGRALSGRARIGVINRAINLAITATSDIAQWGTPNHWSGPLETFTTGHGDCKDYAIAKYLALTAAGVAAADVKLVIVHNLDVNEDHAVTVVRLDGEWIVLDNRWLTMVADTDMAKAIPRFVLDDAGVRRFTSPMLTSARQTVTPTSIGYQVSPAG
jgi:predicted transglutaminase-like cysteine proteinase